MERGDLTDLKRKPSAWSWCRAGPLFRCHCQVPTVLLHEFGLERRRGLIQGWQLLWKYSQTCSIKYACWRPKVSCILVTVAGTTKIKGCGFCYQVRPWSINPVDIWRCIVWCVCPCGRDLRCKASKYRSRITACLKVKVPEKLCGQSAKLSPRAVFHKVWERLCTLVYILRVSITHSGR